MEITIKGVIFILFYTFSILFLTWHFVCRVYPDIKQPMPELRVKPLIFTVMGGLLISTVFAWLGFYFLETPFAARESGVFSGIQNWIKAFGMFSIAYVALLFVWMGTYRLWQRYRG